MDYQAFYNDVVIWIGQVNQAASQYGMQSEQFWLWVAESSSSLAKKYGESRLVIKQMLMLVEWLEEVYEQQLNAG